MLSSYLSDDGNLRERVAISLRETKQLAPSRRAISVEAIARRIAGLAQLLIDGLFRVVVEFFSRSHAEAATAVPTFDSAMLETSQYEEFIDIHRRRLAGEERVVR